AVERAERGPALARAGERIRRRQVPVLPLGGKRVGWRADRNAAREDGGVGPRFGAVRRGADREIAIEPDLEAAPSRPPGRPRELAVGEPLAEESELEALAVAFDSPVDR